MATEIGRDRAPLSEELFEHPGRFEFFQAVRLLRLMRPGSDPVGADTFGHEPVRFHSDLSSRFPTSDIAALDPPSAETDAPRMTVRFMGLATLSSMGSLPSHYARMLREQLRAGNGAPVDFVDLFNHRLISLFYRAWEKYRLVPLSEGARDAAHDPIRRVLVAIGGLETAVREPLPFPVEAVFRWSGHLAHGPVPGHVLESMVGSYFGVEARLKPFVVTWSPLSPERRSRLGVRGRLCMDAVAGNSVCTSQYQFHLRLGPMSWNRYRELLPISPGYRSLVGMVQLAVGADQTFTIELVLSADQVPPLKLGPAPEGDGPRLGWSTWLCSPGVPGSDASATLPGDSRAS
jgi:type VI secretion system protein ImpH